MRNTSILFTTFYPDTLGKKFIDTLLEYNDHVEVIKIDQSVHRAPSRSAAFNSGFKSANGEVLLFCDDDIEWTGRVEIPEARLFGPALAYNDPLGQDWLDGWCIGVDRRLFLTVGGFDENFVNSGHQEIDFVRKCIYAGVDPVQWENFPGVHLGAATKYEINKDHSDTWKDNLQYLIDKWQIDWRKDERNTD